jgi:hypothetical protein
VNATCFLLTGLIAGADTPAKPVAAAPAAPIVVSTGAGCNGCSTPAVHVAAAPCNPCGGHATLVDWMKAKAAEPSKPGLIARLRARHAKPAATTVAAGPCDPCAVGYGGVIVTPQPPIANPVPGTPPAGGGGGVPAEMPKQKDMPKVDPPKDLPKSATPPKTGTDVPKAPEPPKPSGGAIDLPKVPAVPSSPIPAAPGAVKVPALPVIPTSGTNSPY